MDIQNNCVQTEDWKTGLNKYGNTKNHLHKASSLYLKVSDTKFP